MLNIVTSLSDLIRTSLSGTYAKNEIEQLVFLIFNHLLNYSKIDIHLKSETPISEDIYQQVLAIIDQLIKHKPIQYIFGQTEFYGLKIILNHNVLIPRQETEELVHWVIQDFRNKSPRILDIGTGSGCIAITLAKNIPESKVDALDNSPKALEVASENSKINNVSINFINLNIIEPDSFKNSFVYDIIVSNPPYILESEKKLMNRNILENEPYEALFVSDDDPLIFYRNIAGFGLNWLNDNGSVYVEINEKFGNAVKNIFKEYGYRFTELRKDINGRDRMIKVKK